MALAEKSQQNTWTLFSAQCDNIGKTEFPTPQPTSKTKLELLFFKEVISGNSVNSQHLFLKNLKKNL